MKKEREVFKAQWYFPQTKMMHGDTCKLLVLTFFVLFPRSKSSSGLGYHPFQAKLTSPVTGERRRGSMLMVKNGIFVLGSKLGGLAG